MTRFQRTVNALVLESIGYDHFGPTVLITELAHQISKHEDQSSSVSSGVFQQDEMIWIEEQSNAGCPVRNGNALSSPLGSGSLLGDIKTLLVSYLCICK